MVHLVAKESDVKEFAPSCDRNKDFILRVLKEVLPPTATVLEIGSGTGQHAAYFTAQLPQHIWYPTDLSANFPSIRAWANERRFRTYHRLLRAEKHGTGCFSNSRTCCPPSMPES